MREYSADNKGVTIGRNGEGGELLRGGRAVVALAS